MLRLLIDENINSNLVRGVVRRRPELDYARVRDVGLARAADQEILDWAAWEERIVVTHDVTTMTRFALERLARSEAMAGLFVVHQQGASLATLIEDLSLLDECSETHEWAGQVVYLPLR